MNNLPRTKAEARSLGLRQYFTGNPCVKGHVSPRILAGHCKECCREKSREKYFSNPEYAKEWRRLNPGKAREATRVWRQRNLEKARNFDRAYHAANPAKVRHDAALKRARAVNAAPSWVSGRDLLAIYQSCPNGLEVDHIVPLKNDLVCGLHVPWNLQFLTRAENRKKNNHFEMEMLSCA